MIVKAHIARSEPSGSLLVCGGRAMTMHSLAQIGVNTEAEAQNARARCRKREAVAAAAERSLRRAQRSALRRHSSDHRSVGRRAPRRRRGDRAGAARRCRRQGDPAAPAPARVRIRRWRFRRRRARRIAHLDPYLAGAATPRSTCSCAARRSRTRWCRAAPHVQGAPDGDLREMRGVCDERVVRSVPPHWRQRFEVERYTSRRPVQEAMIFESPLLGRVLVLEASCRPPSATSSSITR